MFPDAHTVVRRSPSRPGELQDLLLVLRVGMLSGERLRLPPVLSVQDAEGELSAPALLDRLDEDLVVAAALLAVVREGGLLLGQEPLYGRGLAREIGRDPDDPQALLSERLLEPRKRGEFFAAGPAPRPPEVEEDHLPLPRADPLEKRPGAPLTRQQAGVADAGLIGYRCLGRRRQKEEGGQSRPRSI